MPELKMPAKGKGAAAMLQELNAQHAAPSEPADNIETNVTTLQRTNDSPKKETLPRTNERNNYTTHERTNVAARSKPDLPSELQRTERLEHAVMLSEDDEITVVTVRVSARLNEYMDRYVARINQTTPKRKYRKQDAILEAFAAFYADHPMPPAPENDDL